MISGCEIEMMLRPRKEIFGDDNHDSVSEDSWLNSQKRKLERQKHRAEAVRKMKNTVMAWLHSFQKRSVARA